MMHDEARTIRSVRQTVGGLAQDRKKTVVAVALVAIMAIMWIRVLTGRKPHAAAAAGPQQQAETLAEPATTVRFHDLPALPGRNDCINRDFFAVQNWKRFRKNTPVVIASTDTEVQTVVPDLTQEVVARVAKRLNLEAVLLTKDPRVAEDPQAFVNNQLVRVGDSLSLKDGTDTYVFEVVRIEADSVLVRCRGRQLTLKVAQSNDVNK